MTDRYRPRIPDPQCDHARRWIVSSGGADTAHAATNVCNRPECIEDAKAWATAVTGLPAEHVPDRQAQPSLFP